jgi:hypothetical protein
MTRRTETLAGADAGPSPPYFSLAGLLKIAAAIAVAFVLMYGETWAIQEAQIWSSACPVRSGSASSSGETDGPLRDTAGPIAVLH